MKRNQLMTLTCFVMFIFILFGITHGLYADETVTGQSNEAGQLENRAQAQHAQNLAESAAYKDPQVSALREYLSHAENALDEAKKSEDQNKIAEAQKAYDSAKTNYDEALAREIEAQREEVGKARKSGMGWGKIAHALGVHPGVLGLGHAKKQSRNETGYTAKSEKPGKSKNTVGIMGTGYGHSNSISGKSMGKGSGKDGSAGHGGGHGGGGKK